MLAYQMAADRQDVLARPRRFKVNKEKVDAVEVTPPEEGTHVWRCKYTDGQGKEIVGLVATEPHLRCTCVLFGNRENCLHVAAVAKRLDPVVHQKLTARSLLKGLDPLVWGGVLEMKKAVVLVKESNELRNLTPAEVLQFVGTSQEGLKRTAAHVPFVGPLGRNDGQRQLFSTGF